MDSIPKAGPFVPAIVLGYCFRRPLPIFLPRFKVCLSAKSFPMPIGCRY